MYQTDHTIAFAIYVFSSPAAMAQTPKVKAKAKVATPKPKPKETKETKESKKRKASEANPFESPPDTNQASIRAFAKPSVPDASLSTQSGTKDTITNDHDVVMDTSGAAPEKNVNEERVSSTVAVDTVDTHNWEVLLTMIQAIPRRHTHGFCQSLLLYLRTILILRKLCKQFVRLPLDRHSSNGQTFVMQLCLRLVMRTRFPVL